MTHLIFEGLPSRISKGAILRWLIETGGIERAQVGKIELHGRRASVEVPDEQVVLLAQTLDGALLNHHHIRVRSQASAASPPPADDDHFQRLGRLLAIETQAAEQQTLEAMQRHSGPEAEKSGQTLVQLALRDETAGLGGRVLVTLGKRDRRQPLPWNRLGVGTPVLLSEEEGGEDSVWRGVVSQLDRDTIQVAFNQWPEPAGERPTFRLDLSTDAIAQQRQHTALNRAQAARDDRLAELRRVLLQQQAPAFERLEKPVYFNESLDPSQQEAVRLALAARDVAIIHGPPGTGKTTAVVELIRQAVRRGETVLACAPSNLAVDNIFERLLAAGESVLRLGHPARVLPELRAHTLDLLVDNHPDVRAARKLVREAHALRTQAGKYTRAKPAPGARREMRQEARLMLEDARRMEMLVVERLLNGAGIICATLTGLDSKVLGQRAFDLCVIDEASQSTEPESWIPLLRSQRVVLAGDHFQLPPTVVSARAAAEGFGISLMERLMRHAGADISRRLTVQYRMHQTIMAFSSAEFYEDSLQADAAVRAHLLCDLPGVAHSALTGSPVHFIDTAGASYDEAVEPDGESRLNPQEAALVQAKVSALQAAGVPAGAIAVIAPYSAQVRLLRELLPEPALEVNSVDGFQGREKEAVVMSLVRSNPAGEIGFLADVRRMNVALTRARRKLLVIGDSATITSHPFYQRLVDYLEQVGAYHSVWEELSIAFWLRLVRAGDLQMTNHPDQNTNLISEMRERALAVLHRCVTPAGFRASGLSAGYPQIWARDSMITFLGAAASGDPELLAAGRASLETMSAHQSQRGLVQLNVNPDTGYISTENAGAVDANLWYILGHYLHYKISGDQTFLINHWPKINQALVWLEYQDMNECGLLEIPEAGDWMDLIAVRYNVLYDNVLYYATVLAHQELAKQLPPQLTCHRPEVGAAEIHERINLLMWIDRCWVAEHFAEHLEKLKQIRLEWFMLYHNIGTISSRPFYLPWVAFREYGDWCDSLGNLLAILSGVADGHRADHILRYMHQVGMAQPYPTKAIHPCIYPGQTEWRDYYRSRNLNLPHQYHNGGIWPMIGGFHVAALVRHRWQAEAERLLALLAKGNQQSIEPSRGFNEWLHGETGHPMGFDKQAWSAAMFLYAAHAVEHGQLPLFDDLLAAKPQVAVEAEINNPFSRAGGGPVPE